MQTVPIRNNQAQRMPHLQHHVLFRLRPDKDLKNEEQVGLRAVQVPRKRSRPAQIGERSTRHAHLQMPKVLRQEVL